MILTSNIEKLQISTSEQSQYLCVQSIYMKFEFHAASSRGFADHGWLKANHSFSFASWFNRYRMHFGALRVLNDDVVAPGKIGRAHV